MGALANQSSNGHCKSEYINFSRIKKYPIFLSLDFVLIQARLAANPFKKIHQQMSSIGVLERAVNFKSLKLI